MFRSTSIFLFMAIVIVSCSANSSDFSRKSIEGKWHYYEASDNGNLWLEINNGKFKMYGGDIYERRSGYIKQKSDSLYKFTALEGDDVYDTETMTFRFDGRHLKLVKKYEDDGRTFITTFHYEDVATSTEKSINGYWHTAILSNLINIKTIMKIDGGDVITCVSIHSDDTLQTHIYKGHLEKNSAGSYTLTTQRTFKGKTKEMKLTLINDGRHIKSYEESGSGISYHREIKYSWQSPCTEAL